MNMWVRLEVVWSFKWRCVIRKLRGSPSLATTGTTPQSRKSIPCIELWLPSNIELPSRTI